MINFILKYFDLNPENLNTRTFLVACAAIWIVGTISMGGTGYYASQQIKIYEEKVARNEPEFIQSILKKCDGDLYQEQVVRACMNNDYHANTAEHKKTVLIQRLKVIAWFLFWGAFFFTYFLLLKKQTGVDLFNQWKTAIKKLIKYLDKAKIF